MFNFDFLMMKDGYKIDHRRQLIPGCNKVYENFTPRSSRITNQNKVVFIGLQYLLQRYFIEIANETFFEIPRGKVLAKYQKFLNGYLGPNTVGVEHIANFHELQYVPLAFYSLHEGTHCPLRMPMFTFESTIDSMFWVAGMVEDMISFCMWKACTSATTAYRYRKLLDSWAIKTGGDLGFVPYQCCDFSLRGMTGVEDGALSGLGYLSSFIGTDNLPSIQLATDYYDAINPGAGVMASEHLVMCSGGKETERDTYNRLLDLYPTGIVSLVSDTWDLWNVIVNIIPSLKDKIMLRDGKLVIRPDSSPTTPQDILCGDPNATGPAYKGVVELLWDIFGGTITSTGHKLLDSHIGAIYGDSITEERAQEICERLGAKGFASTNVVLGIGSYTMQYVTRDTYGIAIKGTAIEVNGEERMIFKDPITDSGMKKSAKGRIAITEVNGELVMTDQLTFEQHNKYTNNLLQPIWKDGKFVRRTNLKEIRRRVKLG